MSKPLLAQYAAFLPRDLYFDGFQWQGVPPKDRYMRKAYDAFVGGFKAAGVVPTTMSGYSWDPTAIVVSAYSKLGFDPTADQIRNYIANLQDYAGINGTYDFRRDQHGLGNDSAIVVKWSPTTGDIVAAESTRRVKAALMSVCRSGSNRGTSIAVRKILRRARIVGE